MKNFKDDRNKTGYQPESEIPSVNLLKASCDHGLPPLPPRLPHMDFDLLVPSGQPVSAAGQPLGARGGLKLPERL